MTATRPSVFRRAVARLLPHSQAGKGAAVLAAASGAAQVINVLLSPVLTRLYTPEDFGALAVFLSTLALLVVGISWRYELAILLPEHDGEALRVFALAMVLALVNAVLLGTLLFFLTPRLAGPLGVPTLERYGWLWWPALVGSGSFQALTYYALRRRSYRRLAGTRLTQAVANAGLSVGGGFLDYRPLGLLLGGIAAQVVGVGTLARELGGAPGLRKRVLPSGWIRSLAGSALTYKRFPQFSLAAGLLNVGGLMLPSVLLASLYGAQEAGLYSLAMRIVGLPMTILGTAVGQVFMGEASGAVRDRTRGLASFVRVATRRMMPACAVVVAIGALSPLLFGIVFGSEWQEAGTYAAFLSLAAAAQLLSSPVSTITTLVQRQELQMILDGSRAVAVVAVLVGARALRLSSVTAIAGLAGASVVAYAACYLVNAALAKRSDAARALEVEDTH